MKNFFKYFLCITIVMFIGMNFIRADEEEREHGGSSGSFGSGSYADSKTKKAYKHENSDSYFVLDKEKYLEKEDVIQYEITDFDIHDAQGLPWFAKDADKIYFFTEKGDKGTIDQSKWWKTLYVCKSLDNPIVGLFGVQKLEVAIYTDSLLTSFAENTKNGWDEFWTAVAGGENTKCLTYTVQEVDEEDQFNFCATYTYYANKINSLAKKYEQDPLSKYRVEFNDNLELIKSNCTRALKNADYNDACVEVCLNSDTDYESWNNIFYPGKSSGGHCGFSHRIIVWVLNIIKWIKYLLPVAVIILSILDFIKAMGTSKQDEMKHAQARFFKRLIAAALVFLIPLIVELVIVKLGFDYHDCGIL